MIITNFIEPETLEIEVAKKLSEFGIGKYSYPLNPFQLLDIEKIIYQELDLENCNIRGMLIRGNEKTGIAVNSNRSEYSRRFIIMHEISHYWFHPETSKRVCLEDAITLDRGIEWQANNSAAIALMPKEVIYDIFNLFSGNINSISDFFKVGNDAVKYRLDYLKLESSILS